MRQFRFVSRQVQQRRQGFCGILVIFNDQDAAAGWGREWAPTATMSTEAVRMTADG